MVAEIRDASPKVQPLSVKTSVAGAERRREPRYPCNDPVEIRIVAGDGSRVPGTLKDISRSGLRIEIGISVPKGAEIEIFLSKQLSVTGRVRHCRRVGAKHQAGILIQEAIDASKPGEHLSGEQLSGYLAGQGLTLTQVIRVRDHLAVCSTCRVRMVDTFSVKPQSRRKSS
jgi:PilZ domain/Putative zinc-finger